MYDVRCTNYDLRFTMYDCLGGVLSFRRVFYVYTVTMIFFEFSNTLRGSDVAMLRLYRVGKLHDASVIL